MVGSACASRMPSTYGDEMVSRLASGLRFDRDQPSEAVQSPAIGTAGCEFCRSESSRAANVCSPSPKTA